MSSTSEAIVSCRWGGSFVFIHLEIVAATRGAEWLTSIATRCLVDVTLAWHHTVIDRLWPGGEAAFSAYPRWPLACASSELQLPMSGHLVWPILSWAGMCRLCCVCSVSVTGLVSSRVLVTLILSMVSNHVVTDALQASLVTSFMATKLSRTNLPTKKIGCSNYSYHKFCCYSYYGITVVSKGSYYSNIIQ